MPILAICRGTQALNIVRGGTLHQHLPDLSTEIAHRQTDARRPSPATRSRSTPTSQLARGDSAAPRSRSIDVNSFHHQAIDRLGEGLRVSARAPDGTIEAVEDPEPRAS